MLLCLRVRNLAIIDQLEVELQPGFNVLTGETGAGKSILVSALKLVLGGRARPEVVRTGADNAEVEALFDTSDDPSVAERLQTMGIEDEGELVLRRVVLRTGRSRAYINGRLASAGQLAELAAGLADISSQHEHHTLVEPRSHIVYLDAFGKLAPQKQELRQRYETLVTLSAQLQTELERASQRTEREDLLRFQIQEIDAVALEPGEREALEEERARQRHGERLRGLTGRAEDALYASDDALCAALSRTLSQVEEAAELDPGLARIASQLGEAHAQLEDAARELGAYAREVSTDPERLGELEARIEAIDRLERKYGGSVQAVLEHRERAEHELRELDQGEERVAELRTELEKAQQATHALALKLSAARKRAATKLGKAVSKELSSLSMGDAEIRVEVERSQEQQGELAVEGARLSADGIDRVEFLIATNRGEAPQPLHRIASGGELSRAMLAIKRVLAGLGPAGLYVFDEVDSGVGGAVAEVIGRKLNEVAAHHQVICITHLAQIAVFAKAHYHVRKGLADGRTRSEIVRLSNSEQREEVARMLGGIEITDKTRAAAREMLRGAGR